MIIKEREIEIGKDDDGNWCERRLRPDCGVCGDTAEVHRAYVEPEMGMGSQALELVPCPKCRPALSQLNTTIGATK